MLSTFSTAQGPVSSPSWTTTGSILRSTREQNARPPSRWKTSAPIYDCGDGLHPSDLGYNKMGDAIDLSLFE